MAASGDFEELDDTPEEVIAPSKPSAPASTIAEINADLGQLDELYDT